MHQLSLMHAKQVIWGRGFEANQVLEVLCLLEEVSINPLTQLSCLCLVPRLELGHSQLAMRRLELLYNISLASSILSEAVVVQGGYAYTGLTTRMCNYIIHTTCAR